MRNVLITLLKS